MQHHRTRQEQIPAITPGARLLTQYKRWLIMTIIMILLMLVALTACGSGSKNKKSQSWNTHHPSIVRASSESTPHGDAHLASRLVSDALYF